MRKYKTKESPKGYITIAEASVILDVSHPTAIKIVKENNMHLIVEPRKIFVLAEDIDKFVNNRSDERQIASKEMITVFQAAELVGRCVSTISCAIGRGCLTKVFKPKYEKETYVDKEEVIHYFSNQKQGRRNDILKDRKNAL